MRMSLLNHTFTRVVTLCVTMGSLLAAGCQKDAAFTPHSEQPALHPSRATLPAQFTEVVIASTIDMATQMVVLPDGRLLVAEAKGVVRLVKNDVLQATPFATIDPAIIESNGSRGLMGIGLSSSFATDRYLYLGFTGKSPLRNRIVRIRASSTNPDVAEATGGFVTIHNTLDLSPQGSSGAHNSMSIRMAAGLLYVSTGDNYVPANSQNVDHSAGKVLRMNPDLTPATGNPYAAVTSANNWKKRLWAKGLRNPWTSAVSNAGLLYVSDVGSFEGTGGGATPNSNGVPVEEINVVPGGTRTSELDYGWPNSEGGGANIIHTYRQAPTTDERGSDCAVVGGTFYEPNSTAFPTTTKFPASYNGAYFFGDHCSLKIKYLPAGQQTPQTLNGNPPALSARTPVEFANGTLEGMLAIEASPNGALYYLSRNIIQPRVDSEGSVLVKITYAGTPIPETCNLTSPANADRFTAPAAFTMNVTAADTAVGIQKVEFFSTNTNIAGAPQVKVGEDTSAPYSLSLSELPENAYRLVARCTNTVGGFKESDLVTVTVNGPTAVIDNPVATLTYDGGDVINFSGTASDLEDGSIPASRFRWFADLGHGVGAGAHFHDGPRINGVTSGSFATARNDELDPNVFWRITLQVQDSAGIYHTVFRDIFPNKTNATVTTSPAGLVVNLDGTDRVGPAPFLGVVGMEHQLAAPAQQTLNGRIYQFQSWSQGGAASQTWILPGGNPTITATYLDIGPAWAGQDVGAVSATGSFSGSSTITIQASGADIYGTADEGYLVYRNITGDATITARVASVTNTNVWTKAGVVFRESTAAGARNVATFLSPTASNKYRKQVRSALNGSTTSTASTPNSAVPAWVRVVRSGNSFSSFYSTDGNQWTEIGTPTSLSMGTTLVVGLMATSHLDGTRATVVYDNISITTPAPPTPPPVPTGLACVAGNNQCACTWNAASGATSYSLKRGTASGGPYGTTFSATSPAHTDTTAANGSTYFYVVSASNAAGQSNNSTQVTCTPAAPLPGAPTGLTATSGNTQITLNWTAVSGATSYTVKRSLASGGPYTNFTQSGITGTSYVNTGLTNGTPYYYVVSASNATGEGANSAQATATPQAPPPPGAPSGLTATGGDNRVQLAWNASSGASSYTVKRATASGGPYNDFIAPDVTTTSYNDIAASNGTPYFYVVTASNSNGESGNSNQATATPQPPPAPPATLNATPGNTTVSLSWAASVGATSYRVKRSTTQGTGYTSVQAGITGTTFNDTGRSNGTTYYYVVTASTNLAESGDSGEASATPQPPAPGAPTGVSATAGNAQVTVSWSAVSGATSYTVKRSLTSGGPYTNFTQAGITGTSYVNTGLTNGTPYYYVVSASNGGGEGPNSSQVTATPASGPTWFEVNVNGATPTGSYTVSSGTHTIVGGGADVPGTASAGATDQFKWVYREITGNATIVVRLNSLATVSGQSFVKAGVMMRASTSATSMYASILATPTATNGWRYQYRLTNGGATAQTRQTGNSAIPGYLRLVRSGNMFTASTATSASGPWTTVGTQSMSMPTTYQIGFAVTSHLQGTSTTAVFDNLTITP
jgi:glucose/arabinose dehydrogenase/fibronectin type 3 domain-containing protein/regulation of enolase protein 1 (concanavalin A-like superfamily)